YALLPRKLDFDCKNAVAKVAQTGWHSNGLGVAKATCNLGAAIAGSNVLADVVRAGRRIKSSRRQEVVGEQTLHLPFLTLGNLERSINSRASVHDDIHLVSEAIGVAGGRIKIASVEQTGGAILGWVGGYRGRVAENRRDGRNLEIHFAIQTGLRQTTFLRRRHGDQRCNERHCKKRLGHR